MASAEPVIAQFDVDIELTRATVVLFAAAAAFGGVITQAAGAGVTLGFEVGNRTRPRPFGQYEERNESILLTIALLCPELAL